MFYNKAYKLLCKEQTFNKQAILKGIRYLLSGFFFSNPNLNGRWGYRMDTTWNENEVVHLLLRATFSATVIEVNACLKLGKSETIRRLIKGISLTDQTTKLLKLTELVVDGKALNIDKINDQQTKAFI